ncbi:MAG: PQQ-dependent sugar dehydrogenase [Pseudomonadota bacterium]
MGSHKHSVLAAIAVAALPLTAALAQTESVFESEDHRFTLETVIDGLENPWGMAFLPNGDILVTERPGRLRLIEEGQLVDQPIDGLPDIRAQGQGGLLDVAIDPDFDQNSLVYLSYSAGGLLGSGTTVSRGRLDGLELVDVEEIFRAEPRSRGGRHFGSRLLFDDDGHLFITTGDRGSRDYAQQLDDHRGSMIRLMPDGSVPLDNPFIGQAGALTEIFSYGHRNIQGIALDSETGILWTHEHGPRGGDEVNVIKPGLNYGWPVITYGEEYSGGSIGVGTQADGMEEPATYWVPSIAPSGMAYYDGAAFEGWQGNLFVGALAGSLLVRLETDGEQITHEERLLEDYGRRIRDVKTGPDGLLYLLIDEAPGPLLKMVPAE